MGRRGTPRRGSGRARLAAWTVATLVVSTVATGCGAMARSDLVESAPVRVEGDILRRSGSGLAAFDPLPPPPGAGATSTTLSGPVPTDPAPSRPSPIDRAPGRAVATTSMPAAVPPTSEAPATTATAPPPTVPSAAPTARALVASPNQRIDQALAMVRIDWRNLLLGWHLEFRGYRDGYQGATFPDEHLIQVYVRTTSTPTQLAHVIAHEIGHAVDVTYLDDADRAGFSVLRGRPPDADWWAPDGATDFGSGSGDWAESFSAWATGGVGPWRSTLGPRPDPIQQLAISGLVTARSGIGTPGVTSTG